MKNIKKIILAAFLLLPVSVFAEGMVGTAVLADGLGLMNLYYQHKLSDSSSAVLGYTTGTGDVSGGSITLTSFSAGYKGYFSDYADGGFWEIGAAFLNVTGSTGSSSVNVGSVTLPILVVGYEKTMGSSFVVGGEVGLGTGQGLGVFGLNAAYKF